jgi:hypothetical protein
MSICPNCNIELEDSFHQCPLCGYSKEDPGDSPATGSIGQGKKPDDRLLADYVKLTTMQKRKLFWELSAIILFSGVLITWIIDIVTTKKITWSRYTITICLVLFANTTLFTYARKKLLFLLGGSFISTSLLLVLLDLFNEKIGWGTQLGVPLLLCFYVIVFLLSFLFRITKQHGFNILGLFFMAAGVFALCLEGLLSEYMSHVIRLSWSLIVCASLVPIAVILFFIHYRLSRGIELRRFFHI